VLAPVALDDVPVPVLDVLAPVVLDDVLAPVFDVLAPVVLDDVLAPVLDVLAPVVLDDVPVPVLDVLAPVFVDVLVPVLDVFAPVVLDDVLVPVFAPTAPAAAPPFVVTPFVAGSFMTADLAGVASAIGALVAGIPGTAAVHAPNRRGMTANAQVCTNLRADRDCLIGRTIMVAPH
jgi:hypothetical protein